MHEIIHIRLPDAVDDLAPVGCQGRDGRRAALWGGIIRGLVPLVVIDLAYAAQELACVAEVVPEPEEARTAAMVPSFGYGVTNESDEDPAPNGRGWKMVQPYDHVRRLKERIGPPHVDALADPGSTSEDRSEPFVPFPRRTERTGPTTYAGDIVQMVYRDAQSFTKQTSERRLAAP